jgi:fructoselysine-6-P-deglycase FrlB-like protein
MDDLRALVAPFDPDEPLPAGPDPWDYLPMPEVRPGPPWAMHEMVAAEPALAGRIGRRLHADGTAQALAAAVRAAAQGGEPIVVTGCGTSEHAAMAVAAILRDAWRDAGLPGWGPVAAQAFEVLLDPPARGLVVGISHEGGTAATLAAMEAARGRGARTAAITGTAASPVGRAAQLTLATVEMDRSWCHTVGYVSPIVAAATVADHLAWRTPDPDRLCDRLAAGIGAAGAGATGPATSIAAAVAGADHLLVTASGTDRITARELVLKVEEAAHVPSAMRDLETLLHGHLPATGDRTALVVVLTERHGLEARATRARQALAASRSLGTRCGAILSAEAAALVPDELTDAGRIVVPDDASLPAAVAALLGAAAPLQLLTLGVAAARGTNPDPIRRQDPRYLRAAELADDPSL